MNRIIALVLLVGGIILLGYGFHANDSVASGISRAVTGEPTNHTMLLIACGGALTACGVGGLFWGSRS